MCSHPHSEVKGTHKWQKRVDQTYAVHLNTLRTEQPDWKTLKCHMHVDQTRSFFCAFNMGLGVSKNVNCCCPAINRLTLLWKLGPSSYKKCTDYQQYFSSLKSKSLILLSIHIVSIIVVLEVMVAIVVGYFWIMTCCYFYFHRLLKLVTYIFLRIVQKLPEPLTVNYDTYLPNGSLCT